MLTSEEKVICQIIQWHCTVGVYLKSSLHFFHSIPNTSSCIDNWSTKIMKWEGNSEFRQNMNRRRQKLGIDMHKWWHLTCAHLHLFANLKCRVPQEPQHFLGLAIFIKFVRQSAINISQNLQLEKQVEIILFIHKQLCTMTCLQNPPKCLLCLLKLTHFVATLSYAKSYSSRTLWIHLQGPLTKENTHLARSKSSLNWDHIYITEN